MQKRKLGQNGFAHVEILLIIVVVAILGAAGWFVYQSQGKTDKTLSSFNNSGPTKASPTTTPTPSPATAQTKNELDTLQEYCQGDNTAIIVGSLQYIQNSNGKFGNCAITSNEGGGGMKISKYINNTWTTIYEGNGAFDDNLCTQHKIPESIMSSCPGYYN